jgi:hypothetical protein
MSQCSHATIPLVCLVLCGFKWCLLVAVYHYYTYVFVTCFQEMFVVVPYNLTSTYFQQMFVFQVPGKNVKWKALLILQNKFNFILFQHLQTTAFFFHQSAPTEFLIQTWTSLHTVQVLPTDICQKQQINENGKLQSRTDCLQPKALKMKQKPANKSAKTLTTCKQGGFSLVHTL